MDSETKEILQLLLAGQERIEQRLDKLEEGQTKLEEGQTKLEEGQTKLEQGQIKLEQEIDKLGQGQIKLEQGQIKLEQEIDKLGQGQIKLEQQIDKLEEKVHAINLKLENIIEPKIQLIYENQVAIIAHDKRQDGFETKLEEHDVRLFAVEQAIKAG